MGLLPRPPHKGTRPQHSPSLGKCEGPCRTHSQAIATPMRPHACAENLACTQTSGADRLPDWLSPQHVRHPQCAQPRNTRSDTTGKFLPPIRGQGGQNIEVDPGPQILEPTEPKHALTSHTYTHTHTRARTTHAHYSYPFTPYPIPPHTHTHSPANRHRDQRRGSAKRTPLPALTPSCCCWPLRKLPT